MDQEHLQVLAGRWEDLLADLEDEKCTCLEEMAGCLEDRSNREEEMAGREEETGGCNLRSGGCGQQQNRANRSCVGEKGLVGLLFLIWQVKNSKLLERGSFCSLVNFLGVGKSCKSQNLPS